MDVDTDRLRSHVATVRGDSEWRAVALAALDRFDELRTVETPAREDLEPILEAIGSPSISARSIGCELLLALATRSHAALDAVLRVVTHGKVDERVQLVGSLDYRLPVDLVTELVQFAIRDRSSRVRVRAAERIDVMELDLVEELREQTARETHRVAKQSLELHLAIRTLGYRVTHGEDGSAHVHFRTPSGGMAGFVISREALAEGRIAEEIEAAKKRLRAYS